MSKVHGGQILDTVMFSIFGMYCFRGKKKIVNCVQAKMCNVNGEHNYGKTLPCFSVK